MPRPTRPIFRFDPLAANPQDTVETIIRHLPGRRITLPDGTRLAESAHPLKQFVFDRTGRLFVNVGSHSDDCITPAPITKPCAAGEGASAAGLDLAVHAACGRHLPGAEAWRSDPPHEVFARGLRNSMALALHPQLSRCGLRVPARRERRATCPTSSSRTRRSTRSSRAGIMAGPIATICRRRAPNSSSCCNRGLQILCTANALYKAPFSLLPPHGAPLAMLYYHGAKFPELEGKLLVGLHGYRPTGSRVLVYDVDDHGFPKPARRRCAIMSVARPIRPTLSDRRRRRRRRAVRRADRRLAPRQRRAAARRAGRHDGRRGRRDLAGRGQEPDRHPHRSHRRRSRRRRCPATRAARR